MSTFCDKEKDRTVLDQQFDFKCDSKTSVVVYTDWIECGMVKKCVNKITGANDGSFLGSQGGVVEVKAFYLNGEKVENNTFKKEEK